MSSHLNFLDAYGFICNEPIYRAVKGLGENAQIRTKQFAFAYFPLIAQVIGLAHMAAAVYWDDPASYRVGLFIRGFVEFTYVLTPLLILIDLVMTAVRSYQLQQALKYAWIVDE